MSVLVARGVAKRWTPTTGLAPVDVHVDHGELVVVRGRSGSGKSTLLALFAGWTLPDAGSIEVGGRAPSADQPWREVAIVPQHLALIPELSVMENIADAAPGVATSELWHVVRLLDLEPLVARTTTEISSGQRQRVAIARAIAAAPGAVLVDEPTSFQDRDHADTVVAALVASARAGAAVLVATHDDHVIAAADRVIHLG